MSATLQGPSPLRRSKVHAALMAALVLIISDLASAARPVDESEQLMQEGIQLRRSGRDAEAVKKLAAAYDLKATPRAAAQLGLCLQAVGRWSEADTKLAEAISATKDPWIRKNRKTLKESIEVVKTHLGRIEVVGVPSGSSVTVNGKRVGQLPLPDSIPVNEGTVDVEVASDGFQTSQRTLTMKGGSYQSVVVKLAAIEKASSAPPIVSAGARLDKAPTETTSGFDSPQKDERSILKSPWFWSGVGVVALGVVAAVFLSNRDPKSPAFNDSGNL